jgi:hypothetical protein
MPGWLRRYLLRRTETLSANQGEGDTAMKVKANVKAGRVRKQGGDQQQS